MAISKNTQRFIPRRDIGLESKSHTSEKNPDLPAATSRNTPTYSKQGSPYYTQQPLQPLLLIFLTWLIFPALRNGKSRYFKAMKANLTEKFNTPDAVVNLLSDVSPYLSLKEQESIQDLVGILEAVNILKNIRDGTYHSPHIIRSMSSSMNAQDKKLGIIKALKPYIPSDNHETIDKVIHTYSAVNKVSENLVQYTGKGSQTIQKEKIADRIADTLEIINPLIPPEQQQKINQIRNMVKMYGVMESSQLLEKQKQQETKQVKTQESIDNNNSEKPDSNSKEQKNVTDALKSVLNPEQSQAMEVMMKMAQLLSQKSTDSENEDKN